MIIQLTQDEITLLVRTLNTRKNECRRNFDTPDPMNATAMQGAAVVEMNQIALLLYRIEEFARNSV